MFKFAKGALRSIFLHSPLNTRLWLTYRCNYDCRMCSIQKHKKVQEMSLEELAIVAGNLKKLGTSQVVLTGGEPLLRNDIVDIVKLFKSYNFLIRLQTNGGLHATEDLLASCYRAGLDDISVSIDTLDAKKQDDICRANGVLENALGVLKFCARNYSKQGIISANVVISAQNFFKLPDLVRYFNDQGIFFNPCIFTRNFSYPANYDEKDKNSDFSLRSLVSRDTEKVFQELRTLIKSNYRILTSTRTLNTLEHYMKTGEYKWRCRSGSLSFDILPTGELAPCCDTLDAAFSSPVANFKDKDFLKQYRSKEFKKKCDLRRKKCPGCLYSCYRDPVYLITDLRVQMEALCKAITFRKIFN